MTNRSKDPAEARRLRTVPALGASWRQTLSEY
jgi:hypothetical protein